MPTASERRLFRWTAPLDGPTVCSITEAERVAQDVVARDGVDGGLALPALTAHFGGDGGAVLFDGFGELVGKVEITADTSGIGAIHAEDGFGAVEIGRVFDLAILGDALGIEIAEIDDQGFQLGKFVREGRRIADALAFLRAVVEARSFFWSIHRNGSFLGYGTRSLYHKGGIPSVTIGKSLERRAICCHLTWGMNNFTPASSENTGTFGI